MTLLIAGSRTLIDPIPILKVLDSIPHKPKHVVVGGAQGVDTIAEQWAVRNHIPYTRCDAEWNNLDAPGAIPVKRKDGTFYNKRAGYDRNVRMGALADELLAFHADGSKGTQNMIDVMRRLKKGVTIVYLKP